MMVP
ncbi:hypothetical protein ECEC1870_2762, partial [Escherichia coli EC1870]